MRINLPPERFRYRSKTRSQCAQTDGANHQQIHIAGCPRSVGCQGAINKGKLDARETLKGFGKLFTQAGGFQRNALKFAKNRVSDVRPVVEPVTITTRGEELGGGKFFDLSLQGTQSEMTEAGQFAQVKLLARISKEQAQNFGANLREKDLEHTHFE